MIFNYQVLNQEAFADKISKVPKREFLIRTNTPNELCVLIRGAYVYT